MKNSDSNIFVMIYEWIDGELIISKHIFDDLVKAMSFSERVEHKHKGIKVYNQHGECVHHHHHHPHCDDDDTYA